MDGLRRALAISLLVSLVSAPGCGPVAYIKQVTRTASADVEAARRARAPRMAPYWYTLAVLYLRKAREEAAESNFEVATRLGRKASEAARVAIELARSSTRRGAGEPAPGSP
jgi:Domain of unknown function (DUF4398)